MDWMSILNQCLDVLLPAVASVIAILFGVLGAKIKNAYTTNVQNETIKTVVKSVVEWAQQVYKDLNGAERLQKALTEASTILNEKGITISDTELNMLIESAVYGLKQGATTSTTVSIPASGIEETTTTITVKDSEATE